MKTEISENIVHVIILDISGEEKKSLTVEELLEKFAAASGSEFSNDRMILG